MSTQREIKFRAWHNVEKRWIEPGWVDVRASGTIVRHYVHRGYNIGEDKNPDYLEFSQYTGLKDKNGKEIYEGDILRIGEDDEDDRAEIVKVEWLERYPRNGAEMCAFMLVGAWDKEFAHFYDYAFCGLEVIGNIYENPELLEKK